MSDATLRIKNLSIALEALSRINSGPATSCLMAVERFLMEEIEKKEKENQWPHPARPASTSFENDPYINKTKA